MFRQITVENLKIFGDRQVVDLAPLTLIYGPNSGGKSTLLQALLLLKQTLESEQNWLSPPPPLLRGPLTDLGSFPLAVHRQETSRMMRVGVTCDLGLAQPEVWDDHDSEVEYERIWAWEQKQITAEFGLGADAVGETRLSEITMAMPARGVGCVFAVSDEQRMLELSGFGSREMWDRWIGEEIRRKQEFMRHQPFRHEYEFWSGQAPFSSPVQVRNPHFTMHHFLPELSRWASFADNHEAMATSTWPSVIAGFEHILRHSFRNLSYLGPLRRAPERFFRVAGGTPATVGYEGQHYAELLVEHVPQVNSWLERLDIPYLITVAQLRNPLVADFRLLQLTDRRNGATVSPQDVGFGISQVLPIVVQCLGLRGAETICIEQPELHLHPRLQAELADLFISRTQIEHYGWGGQLLIETHSESLLLRIQRRIREGSLQPKQVAVLYVDPQSDGASIIQRLRINRAGMFIDEWPKGFFEERLRETLAGYDN